MAFMSNTAESGLANGTGLTNGNSSTGGAGDAFATSIGAGSSIVYSTAQKMHGSLGHLFTVASSESAYLQWTVTSGAALSMRFYAYFPAAPSGTSLICQVRNGAQAAQIGLGSDMRLRVQNATSADLTASWGALSTSTWYRIEMIVTKGATTSTGRIQCKVFLGDGTSVVSGMDLDNAATNTGTADMNSVRFGRAGATAVAHTFYLDSYAAQDSASFLGAYGANVKPTVTAVSSTTIDVVAGGTATFSWSESDSDGTIASRSVTRLSGPGSAPTLSSPTTTSRSATFPTQGVHVYRVTATDDDGAVSDPVDFTIRVSDTTSKPTSVVANTGAFTNQGGAASLQAAVGDASDTTFARSPDNPSGAAIEFGHYDAPLGLGVPKMRAKLKISAASPAITATVTLKQGSTTIATRTTAVTTTATWYEWTLTSGEAAAITDRAALSVVVSGTV
jgi:hypothetical protein